MTTECSWRLCPIPGIYADTSMPLVKRTRATFRSAEFGFFGVVVNTFKHTPRLNGDVEFTGRFKIVLKYNPIAGDLDFSVLLWRPFLISCLMVGILFFRMHGVGELLRCLPRILPRRSISPSRSSARRRLVFHPTTCIRDFYLKHEYYPFSIFPQIKGVIRINILRASNIFNSTCVIASFYSRCRMFPIKVCRSDSYSMAASAAPMFLLSVAIPN